MAKILAKKNIYIRGTRWQYLKRKGRRQCGTTAQGRFLLRKPWKRKERPRRSERTDQDWESTADKIKVFVNLNGLDELERTTVK